MSIIVQMVDINCRGRDADGNEVLIKAIPVTISLKNKEHLADQENVIMVEPVKCRHHTGGGSHRCKALRPEEDKTGRGGRCPFSFKYPYVLRYKPEWRPPEEIAAAFLIAQNT